MTDNFSISQRIAGLSPTDFENLVYDCVRAIGLTNLVWRTPGADGGRDIEGELITTDVTGYDLRQKWYVECKRYSTSINWSVVWDKLAHADVQNADVLFLVTNNNPSPNCETQINKWNASRRRPIIRLWRGYELPRILRTQISIARAHGLIDPIAAGLGDGLDLALVINKLVQSAYSATLFEQQSLPALEAASCLSELLSQRLSDLRKYGKFVNASIVSSPPDFEWLKLTGHPLAWEEVAIRALLSFVRHVSSCNEISATVGDGELSLELIGSAEDLSNLSTRDLNTVLLWARSEMDALNAPTNSVLFRHRLTEEPRP